MLQLPNGCKCSEPSVHPKNWKTKTAKTDKPWYILYWFYDPSQPKPKQMKVKGMNTFSDLKARQNATMDLLEVEKEDLLKGYNPFLKKIIRQQAFEIEPETPFIKALHLSLKRLTVEKKTKDDIRNILVPFGKAATQLHYEGIPIGAIRKKHIRTILDKCYSNSSRFSNNTYNHYRKYLGILFNELVDELEVLENNPALGLKKKKTVKTIRKTLTTQQRKEVNEFLFQKHYHFWRFLQIFFHSGGRITELMKLKKEDVHLSEQQYKTIVLKRKVRTEELRTIKDIALPFWEEVYLEAKCGEFLFSKGLQPGKTMIRPDQITKRWYRLVKKKEGGNIEADFYSLKHSNTTEIVELMNEQAAAKFNGHTSTAMVRNIYDTGRKDREHEQLKKVNNKFA